jgi:nucleoside-diphosphate-sugar epimerase
MFLVTGASGFIGGHLVELLRARGADFRCLVRRTSSVANLPPEQIALGDLATGQGLEEALRDVNVVIHLAGVTKALRAEDYYAGNARASEVLAGAMRGRGIRLIQVSSLAAAGPSLNGKPLCDDAEPRPITVYGKSKLEGERGIRALLPDAVIVRPPVVYGPRDTGVLQVLKPISKGWSLEIGGGQHWFSFIYVNDFAEALLACAANPQAAGKTYFVAHPKPVAWSQLAATAAAIMRRRIRTLRLPPAMARVAGACADAWSRSTGKPGVLSREKILEAQCAYWTCDPGRAAAEWGFEARTSIEDGLAKTLAWYKEAGWLQY